MFPSDASRQELIKGSVMTNGFEAVKSFNGALDCA